MSMPSPRETQLLAIVANGERSGRDVAKEFKEETETSISYGTLYTTFRRMKETGWVEVRDSEDEDGRVRYFRITAPGIQALEEARNFYAKLSTFGLPGKTAFQWGWV